MPRFRFILALLIVGVAAMVATLAADRREQQQQPGQVDADRQRWFDEQRLDRDFLSTLGFAVVVEQRGLVVVEHDTGHCFLATHMSAPFLEVDPYICENIEERRAAAERAPENPFLSVPR